MARTRSAGKRTTHQSQHDEAPARKNFRLHQSKLDAARKVLGTQTEAETIELALDLVAFGERLAEGTARARARRWRDPLGEREGVGSKAEK